MKRFENILLLYDGSIGSEAALDRAQALAQRNDARLTVIDVIQRRPRDLFSRLIAPRPEELLEHRGQLSERCLQLKRLVQTLDLDDARVAVEVRDGITFVEAIRKVLRDDHDLVIMTPDRWTGVRPFAFGSTTMHMQRKCPCPVWVVAPDAPTPYRRILAAIDPAGPDDLAHGLDRKILELASSLSSSEESQLDVLHAWDLQGADRDMVRSGITNEKAEDILNRARTGYEATVRGLFSKADLDREEPAIHLPHGKPWEIIPQFAAAEDVDLLVMGTITRTGIAGLFIGDNAELVLQQVSCSVLALKPDGFQTPVTLEDGDWLPRQVAG